MPELSPAQREALGALLNAAPFAGVVRDLGRRFAERGHELYLVGGTVRDALLDRASPDVDLTTDATPDQILAVVRAGRWSDGVWLQGVRYGTVGVRKGDFRLEITTFRSDTYREDSRKPEVTFGRSIDEDLARRDFTVNAMAMKLPDGPFVDPHGGLGDLAAKRLRTPSSPEVSFEDDPLRMLRAARFASQLGAGADPRDAGRHHRAPRAAPDRLPRADPRRAEQAAAGPGAGQGPVAGRQHRPGRRVPARAAGPGLGAGPGPPPQGRAASHHRGGRAGDRLRRRRARPHPAHGRPAPRHRQAPDPQGRRTKGSASTSTRWSGPRWPRSG